MNAYFHQHILKFKHASGTSRGILNTKETFILEIDDGQKKGIGECAVFRGLSYDDCPDYEEKLQWLCDNINLHRTKIQQNMAHYPSIWFGYEQAMQNLKYGQNIYFPSDFTRKKGNIKINGLIWMGDMDFMRQQITEKLELGFDCIKLKIGINWDEEYLILKELRKRHPASQLELRVDANGGFSFEEVRSVLELLSELKIHSIEQPIKAGNWQQMKQLCHESPVPIALDEELIGVIDNDKKVELLDTIKPQYIILKPSLCGGFSGSDQWIALASKRHIGWWITSALESNIGLNAIAQYTFTKQNTMPQGLGTGGLFTNNSESHLNLNKNSLSFR